MAIIEQGQIGFGTRYMITHENSGGFQVFIGGISRITKKSIRGAYGVLRKIDPNFASDSTLRMRAANQEAREALRTNTCPTCGGQVHRNLSLTGWVQCDGLGAEGFRKNPNAKPCSWQGFTGE
jgi:hypothetical protein